MCEKKISNRWGPIALQYCLQLIDYLVMDLFVANSSVHTITNVNTASRRKLS